MARNGRRLHSRSHRKIVQSDEAIAVLDAPTAIESEKPHVHRHLKRYYCFMKCIE